MTLPDAQCTPCILTMDAMAVFEVQASHRILFYGGLTEEMFRMLLEMRQPIAANFGLGLQLSARESAELEAIAGTVIRSVCEDHLLVPSGLAVVHHESGSCSMFQLAAVMPPDKD